MFVAADDYRAVKRSNDFVLREPVQLGDVTVEELRAYDGSDPNKPLLMAIKGQIYDVSRSRYTYLILYCVSSINSVFEAFMMRLGFNFYIWNRLEASQERIDITIS